METVAGIETYQSCRRDRVVVLRRDRSSPGGIVAGSRPIGTVGVRVRCLVPGAVLVAGVSVGGVLSCLEPGMLRGFGSV